MKQPSIILLLTLVLVIAFSIGKVAADEIRVAVASNFTTTIKALAHKFETDTGHKVKLIFGSTGKQYAQIKNGAPFDAYFAADTRRPELLEKDGFALPGSRFTYATGKLVLWSPEEGYVDAETKVLARGDSHLAIANPKLAPYGYAAKQVLQALGLWDSLRGRMVRGENIGQAFQFVKSGNVKLGFVAFSQIKQPGRSIEGSFWKVPQVLFSPIEQQAVLLTENAVARAFLSFVQSDGAQHVIQEYGYGIP